MCVLIKKLHDIVLLTYRMTDVYTGVLNVYGTSFCKHLVVAIFFTGIMI